MTQVEQQKLAAEIAAQADAAITDWASIPELADYHGDVHTYSGKTETLYFNELVAEYEAIKAEMDFREVRLKEIKDAISTGVLICGKQRVSCNGWKMCVVEKAGSKKILPERLISQGVTPEQIAKATEIGKSSIYVDLRKAKERD